MLSSSAGMIKSCTRWNPKNGEVLWDFATKGRVDGSPVIVDNRVFVGSADGRIYGLDLKTGQELWNTKPAASSLAARRWRRAGY